MQSLVSRRVGLEVLGHKNWPQGEFYKDAKAQSSIAVKHSYAFSSGARRAVFAKR